MSTIDKNGFWTGNVDNKHYFDEKLSKFIVSFLIDNGIQSVLDLGCGKGLYAKSLVDSGIICDCYDGHPDTEILTDNNCHTLDLSQPIDLNKMYDCVMSLEVGEHIPELYEDIFINNICKHSTKYLIVSWAIPGQDGYGHINCKTNTEIINKIQMHNYMYHKNESNFFRQNSSAWWFKNTIMIFSKKEHKI